MFNIRTFFTALSLILLSILNAQDYEGVSIAKRFMSKGTNNSYLVELTDVNQKTVVEAWEEFLDPYRGKMKYNRKKEEYVTVGATVPQMGTTTIYAKIVEEITDPTVKTTMIVWFQSPEGFVGEGGDSSQIAKGAELVQSFAAATSQAHAREVLDTEQRHLADLEKELKNLRKDREDYQETIRKAEETLSETRRLLNVNAVDIQNREREVEHQRQAVKRAESATIKAVK